jgi:hypothetical protein
MITSPTEDYTLGRVFDLTSDVTYCLPTMSTLHSCFRSDSLLHSTNLKYCTVTFEHSHKIISQHSSCINGEDILLLNLHYNKSNHKKTSCIHNITDNKPILSLVSLCNGNWRGEFLFDRWTGPTSVSPDSEQRVCMMFSPNSKIKCINRCANEIILKVKQQT